MERVSELIGKIAPEYARAAEAYLSGGYHCGYNCYVMKNMLFDRLQAAIFGDGGGAARGELPADARLCGRDAVWCFLS